MTLDEKIAQAQRHVDSGRVITERQRTLAARLGSQSSADLLDLFERTQRMYEADLAELLTRKPNLSRPSTSYS